MKDKLIKYLDKIAQTNYIITILRWEMDTIAPTSSFEYLIQTSTNLEMESFKLCTSNEYLKLLNDLIKSDEFKTLKEVEKRYILKLKKDYTLLKRIPNTFYEMYSKLRCESLNAWVKAKNENDYSIFKPYLIKIIKKTKNYYNYMFPNSTNIYENMISTYEEGMTTKEIDKLFNELKKEIIPIIKKLKKNKKTLNNTYSNDTLYKLSKYLLNYIGFDNDRGALGIYTHGYTVKFNDNDVRIAFNNEEDIISLIATIVHEGGHGIFEQNISNTLKEYKTYDIDKLALHESQSRFYENMLMRNVNFYKPIYNDIKKLLNINIDINEFVSYFNNAYPSKIRIFADELTYALHIIIRYEIERDIFNGNIDLNSLDKVWNNKYKEYLNLNIVNDREGILQDMHWASGDFGYFPTYLLGSIFDGMLYDHINKNVFNINEKLRTNKIQDITLYLNNHIHKYGGSYNISEVSNRLFKKDLDVSSLVKYFKEKYDK